MRSLHPDDAHTRRYATAAAVWAPRLCIGDDRVRGCASHHHAGKLRGVRDQGAMHVHPAEDAAREEHAGRGEWAKEKETAVTSTRSLEGIGLIMLGPNSVRTSDGSRLVI